MSLRRRSAVSLTWERLRSSLLRVLMVASLDRMISLASERRSASVFVGLPMICIPCLLPYLWAMIDRCVFVRDFSASADTDDGVLAPVVICCSDRVWFPPS